MMKHLQRILAIVLTFAVALSFMPAAASVKAAGPQTSIYVESGQAMPGETIDVHIKIKNNPGVMGATLVLTYDEKNLTLTGAKSGDAFSMLDMTLPGKFVSGCKFPWDAMDLDPQDVRDGDVLVLTFKVSEQAAANTNAAISVNCVPEDIYDNTYTPIPISFRDGYVQIVDYLPGDVSGDQRINTMDVSMLRREIAGGYTQKINRKAGNVNGDNRINTVDVSLIRRYIAGGYNVELKPSVPYCDHTMEAVPYKAATCTVDGNIAYWHCTKCDKYYSDAQGNTQIELQNTVIKATGHTEVIDPYVAPQPGVEGWTEGSHCSVCGEVIVPQQRIEPLAKEEYAIEYRFTSGKKDETGEFIAHNNDPYLEELLRKNQFINENPAACESSKTVTLQDPRVEGYDFLGWFNGSDGAADRVRKIDHPTGNQVVYAHLIPHAYKVQYSSPLVPKEAEYHYVNEVFPLNPPGELAGYRFIGWNDKNAQLMTEIPKGIASDVEFTANWASDRNITRPAENIGEPIIDFDEVNKRIVFAYEIGTVENIPLAPIKFNGQEVFNVRPGTKIEQTTRTAAEITEKSAQTISNAVAEATTKSSEWTLSSEWNESTKLSEAHKNEVGTEVLSSESNYKNSKGNWYVSSSASGRHETHIDTTQGVSTKLNSSVGAQATASVPISVVKVEGKVSAEISSEVNTDGRVNTSETDLKTWNANNGFSGSRETSQSTSLSQSMAQKISNTKGYEVSKAATEGSSSTQSTASTNTNTREYASSMAYTTQKLEETTYTIAIDGTAGAAPGYYRYVQAGIAHVFAVVTYDIADRAYGVYTYSILDDRTYPYLDYSKDSASFNDYENGVLPMVIPAAVDEYVNSIAGTSDGLEINQETGMISGYNGKDTIVIVPQYYSIQKGSHREAIKVNGIEPGAFANKRDIVAVQLPDTITSIPDDAFSGCSSLVMVKADGVTSIGANAFADCTALKDQVVSVAVTSLGRNAYKNVGKVTVHAANTAVADAAVEAHAKFTEVDLRDMEGTLADHVYNIPASVEHFMLDGAGKSYNNIVIHSDAKRTSLHNMTFAGNSETPLTASSETVDLNTISIRTPDKAAVFTAPSVRIGLQGTNNLGSDGDHAVSTNHVEFFKSQTSTTGKLVLDGNLLVTGRMEDPNQLLSFTRGRVVYLNPEDKVTVTFDPNGGTVEEQSREVYYGLKLGELPVPERKNYAFQGWYTAAEDGTQYTADTVLEVREPLALYAHWSSQTFKISWNENPGYKVEVNRTASPQAGAATGRVNNGDAIYYGDVLEIRYVPNAGYVISNTGITSVTVTGELTASEIYAVTGNQGYRVSWNGGTGYGISVERTSSPRGAATGRLDSGAEVYYGDVLRVSYGAANGYSLTGHGDENITVTGNVDGSRIYASAKPNQYTYRILYRSVNGTDLGNDTITRTFGTVNDVGAPGISGYNTPGVQHVAWDVAGSKDIVFHYEPQAVSTPSVSGRFTDYIASGKKAPTMDYGASFEYRNRTADSVELRYNMSITMAPGFYDHNGLRFRANAGGISMGDVWIVPHEAWGSVAGYARTKNASTDWVRVPVGTTNATSATINVYLYECNYNGTDVTHTPPGYSNMSKSWQVNVPAF